MDYLQIIKMIRHLSRGENVCTEEICSMLFLQECYYLLSQCTQWRSRIKLITSANCWFIKQQYLQVARIFSRLSNVPYAHIKGAPLSLSIYQNEAYRVSNDIDILVAPSNIEEIQNILYSEGFVQGRILNDKIMPYTRNQLVFQNCFTHQIAPFIKKNDNVNFKLWTTIDVNHNIIWGGSTIDVDMDSFILNTAECNFHGFLLNRLRPEWEFISLCLHHYKDMNSIYLLSQNGLRLSEFCDIYYYILNVGPDIQVLSTESRKYNVDQYVYYCLYFTNEIFDDKRLQPYLSALFSDNGTKLLNSYGLDESEQKKWSIPFFERLLCDNFKTKFFSMLTEEDRRKLHTNIKMLT